VFSLVSPCEEKRSPVSSRASRSVASRSDKAVVCRECSSSPRVIALRTSCCKLPRFDPRFHSGAVVPDGGSHEEPRAAYARCAPRGGELTDRNDDSLARVKARRIISPARNEIPEGSDRLRRIRRTTFGGSALGTELVPNTSDVEIEDERRAWGKGRIGGNGAGDSGCCPRRVAESSAEMRIEGNIGA